MLASRIGRRRVTATVAATVPEPTPVPATEPEFATVVVAVAASVAAPAPAAVPGPGPVSERSSLPADQNQKLVDDQDEVTVAVVGQVFGSGGVGE